jgi:hypothetical protein
VERQGVWRSAPKERKSLFHAVLGNKTKPVSFDARRRTHLESVALLQDTKDQVVITREQDFVVLISVSGSDFTK